MRLEEGAAAPSGGGEMRGAASGRTADRWDGASDLNPAYHPVRLRTPGFSSQLHPIFCGLSGNRPKNWGEKSGCRRQGRATWCPPNGSGGGVKTPRRPSNGSGRGLKTPRRPPNGPAGGVKTPRRPPNGSGGDLETPRRPPNGSESVWGARESPTRWIPLRRLLHLIVMRHVRAPVFYWL